MKIMHLFVYFGTGGAEEHAIVLAKAALGSGYESCIWFDQIAPGVKKRLKDLNIKTGRLSLKSSFNPKEVLASARQLKKITKAHQIDIIHTHMLREHGVAIVAKFLGARFKLVRTFHRFDQFNSKMRLLIPICQHFTDAFIAVSKRMAKYMRENGIKRRVTVINNGVPAVIVDNHQPALGFMGRLHPEKGIYEFIKQNQGLLKQQKLVVAGDGPDRAKIEKLVKKNKLEVTLLGRVDNKEKFFSKISVLVMPSSAEVAPLVVFEAFSCGLPVAAFNVDGLSEIIGNDNGSLVSFPDYKALGQQAIKILDKSSNYSIANRKLYREKFSDTTMWNQTLRIYKSL